MNHDAVTELLHENYRFNRSQYFKKQRMKCTEGYHKQNLPSGNFYEVLQYIKSHDGSMLKKMTKKSRLEKLLDLVEIELQSKSSTEEAIEE